jgi:hypothetical protein
MAKGLGWLRMVWTMMDERLAAFAASLQRIVRVLRFVVAALIVAILVVLVSPIVLWLWPEYFPIAYAVTVLILSIPIIVLTVLVALPLRMTSVVRLIDKGYPANAKEIAIRVAARKLHDESIATEELLVETAINEGRKAFRRYSEWKENTEPAPAADQGDPPAASGSPPGAPPLLGPPPRGRPGISGCPGLPCAGLPSSKPSSHPRSPTRRRPRAIYP